MFLINNENQVSILQYFFLLKLRLQCRYAYTHDNYTTVLVTRPFLYFVRHKFAERFVYSKLTSYRISKPTVNIGKVYNVRLKAPRDRF